MAIVRDYIAKCGCRIRVDDSDYANESPEEIQRRIKELYRCEYGIRWRWAERKLAEMEKQGLSVPTDNGG